MPVIRSLAASALAMGLLTLPCLVPAAALAGGTAETTAALPVAATQSAATLKAALDAIDAKNVDRARAIAAPLSQLERDVVTWMAIRRGISGLQPGEITAFARRRPDWPSVSLMRRRAEQALADMNLSPTEVVAAFASSRPVSETGTLLLARADLSLGRKSDAARLIASWWIDAALSTDRDKAIIAEFGSVLSAATIKAHYRSAMYADRMTAATALAHSFPDEGYAALADARAAVLRGRPDVEKKLGLVTGPARRDALYAFTLAEWHRRGDRPLEAAKAILSVKPEDTADYPDAWWVERRIVSRDLAERNDATLAYKVIASQRGGDTSTLQEAYFHAGWLALRFLKKPDLAIAAFNQLATVSNRPISRARAAYWLARTYESAGRIDEAREHYRAAAGDEFTYYGQLARVKLSATSLGLPPVPKPTDADRAAFATSDLVRVLALLVAAGHEADAAILYPELAGKLPTGGQVALLAAFAEDRGQHRMALIVGKTAADRNLGAERLAFPLEAIPVSVRHHTAVETPLVYAIARQESAFDPAARSRAGALGLLQLIPTTAKATARDIGVAFDKTKLTSDPGYNATLGAAHLKALSDEFGGSYILTFAAYNAGKNRVKEWIQRFGDPRNPRVDPIDWIEQIPYGETRNYVQRVLENLQVYRERLDGSHLAIAKDLTRGG